MKKVFFLLSFLILSVEIGIAGDWQNGTANSKVYMDGSIGIGTDQPEANLHIKNRTTALIKTETNANSLVGLHLKKTGSTNQEWKIVDGQTRNGVLEFYNASDENTVMAIKRDHIGIGTTSPRASLHVVGQNAAISVGGEGFRLTPSENLNNNDPMLGIGTYAPSAGKGFSWIRSFSNDGHTGADLVLMPSDNGGVCIGTTTSGNYKLTVEGTIGAREIVVTQASWADYVLEDDYPLRSLSEVESFIKENRHLPEVPSAKQVKEDGINMSEMLTIQMKKIEELTLHLINQNKMMMAQNNKITQLTKKIATLEAAK